jgi:hypothetical protein
MVILLNKLYNIFLMKNNFNENIRKLRIYSAIEVSLLIIGIFLILILSNSLDNTNVVTVSSQPIYYPGWMTLSYDPYRRASVSLSYGSGAIASPVIKWYYMFDSTTEGHYSFNINNLIVDIDNNGQYEVVAVDAAGRLVILRGTDGVRLSNVSIDASAFSTPSSGDIDNDNILEFIVGTKDGYVIALDIDPTTWSISTLWRSDKLENYIGSSPLLYDLDGDGSKEVTVVTKFGMVCLNSSDGNVIWRRTEYSLVFVGSVALLGDINGDSVSDLVYGDVYGYVYAISGNDGSELWKVDLWANSVLKDYMVIHTPAVSDVDGDGTNEVVISIGREVFDWIPGTDSKGTTSTGLKVAKTGTEGYIAILNSVDGTIEDVIQPPTGRGLFAWFAQPALSIIDYDGDGVDEIFVGSGDGYLYRIEYQSGAYSLTELTQCDTYWPNQLGIDAPPISMSIVIVDIDGDNSYEVLVLSSDGDNTNNWKYTLYAINPSTGAIEWSRSFIYQDFNIANLNEAKYSWPSISVWDIDGDSNFEIIVNLYQAVVAIDG